jgi:hypothetical protein
VYALGLALIAAVCIGFAVADGRRTVIIVESGVAAMFVLIAAAGVTWTAWLTTAGSMPSDYKFLTALTAATARGNAM